VSEHRVLLRGRVRGHDQLRANRQTAVGSQLFVDDDLERVAGIDASTAHDPQRVARRGAVPGRRVEVRVDAADEVELWLAVGADGRQRQVRLVPRRSHLRQPFDGIHVERMALVGRTDDDILWAIAGEQPIHRGRRTSSARERADRTSEQHDGNRGDERNTRPPPPQRGANASDHATSAFSRPQPTDAA
jgi:hypothetical protein